MLKEFDSLTVLEPVTMSEWTVALYFVVQTLSDKLEENEREDHVNFARIDELQAKLTADILVWFHVVHSMELCGRISMCNTPPTFLFASCSVHANSGKELMMLWTMCIVHVFVL